MYDPKRTTKPSPRDRLITRPDKAPLPTPLDPAGPQARGYPADPRPEHVRRGLKCELADTGEWQPLPEDLLQTV